MLPKSEHRVYVGYNKGNKSVKYYVPATRNILVLRNFCFLSPAEPSPTEEIIVELRSPLEEAHTPLSQGECIHPREEPHGPPCEGELRRSTHPAVRRATPENYIRTTERTMDNSTRLGKRKAEDPIDPQDPKKSEHSIDYYVNNPFPDKEEAGIVEVWEEVFVVIPETDPDSLKEAQESRTGQNGSVQYKSN